MTKITNFTNPIAFNQLLCYNKYMVKSIDLSTLSEEKRKQLAKIHNRQAWGFKNKKVFVYPSALFDALRPYCYGGFPVSIMVMINELCNGLCYDRAALMSLAFSDATIVYGNIESLRITSGEEYAEHAFVETKEFGGNKTWVVDTSAGLIYEKDFYYDLQKVKVNHIIPKEVIMQSPEIHDVINANFENDKYALPMTMPLIENAVKNSNWLGTLLYKDITLSELEDFKAAIHYDAIVAEIDEDLKSLRRDPHSLDEKFKIVRDKYGREISRNGIPNPYYISPEDADALQSRYNDVQDDPEVLLKLIAEDCETSFRQSEIERQENARRAKIRYAQIQQNPTANFYDEASGPSSN